MKKYILADKIQDEIINELYHEIFMCNQNKVLALDTGIGKTIVAGCVINRFLRYKKKTVCVICSPNVYQNVWADHLQQYNFTTYYYHGLDRKDIYYNTNESIHIPDMKRFDIVFTSYEIFSLESELILHDNSIGLIVIDEIQKVLNNKKDTDFIKAILETADVSKLALTATPLQNSIMDILVLGNIIQGFPDSTSLDRYKYYYSCIEKNQKNGSLSIVNEHDFKEIIQCANEVKEKMIIYFSKEGYSEIDHDIHFVERLDYAFFLPLNENESIGYKNIEMSSNINNKSAVLTYFISYPLLKKYKKYLASGEILLQSITKYRAARSIITSVSALDKVVVFSNYKNVIEFYKNGFYADGISALSITGDNSINERSLILNKFKSDQSVKVLLMTLSASAEGLNIEVANNVIFIDMWHNPAKHKQGSDRVHRRTQVRTCYVYYLIANKCASEISLLRTLQRKSLFYQLIFNTSLFDIHSYRINDNKNIEKEISIIVNQIQKVKQIPDAEVEVPKQEYSKKTIFDTLTELELMKKNPTYYSNNCTRNPDDDIVYMN